MTFDSFDVVVVPFPFTDKMSAKRRPALVVSNQAFNAGGSAILCMITTKAHPVWPGDTQITDPASAGLHFSCIVRLKMFTLDDRLVVQKIGKLSEPDADTFIENLQKHLPL